MSDVARAFAQMLTKSPEVPEHVISGILACGDEAVPPLVAVLDDRSLDGEGHPSGGVARVHAAELLGHLDTPAAVPPLLDAIVVHRANAKLVQAVARALAQLHTSLDDGITDAALSRLAASTDVKDRMMLAMVLASAPVHHPDVVQLLRDLLPQDPDIVLPMIATYRQPELAPDVAQVLLKAGEHRVRVVQAVHTLRQLGHSHPKLDALANKADEVMRYELSQELLEGLVPDLAVLMKPTAPEPPEAP